MSKFFPFGGTTYNLSGSISSTATSITLASFLEPVTGTPYTMALLNTDIAYGTIAPKTTSSEFISFTGITQNSDGTATLTGVTRGLAKKYPFTTSSAYKLPHPGQTQFIISDAPQVFIKYASLENDNHFTGNQTFDGDDTFTAHSPTIPTESSSEVNRAATIGYVNGVAIAGAPDASTTVKGITKLSVAPVSATNPIAVGDNDNRVSPVSLAALTSGEVAALPGDNTDVAVGSGNKYVTQTGLEHNAEKYAVDNSGSSTAYTIALSPIPTSLTDGMVVYAKLVNANTTATPSLNVNSIGAHTIVKKGGSALVAGDIATNMLCTFIYDLSNTRWVLQNPQATAPIAYAQGVTTYNLATASGAQTIAHGLGVAPTRVKLTGYLGATVSTLTNVSSGVSDGTNQTCIASNGIASMDVNSTSFTIYFRPDNNVTAQTQSGVVSVDATNITITWTKTNSPTGTAMILWEAQKNN